VRRDGAAVPGVVPGEGADVVARSKHAAEKLVVLGAVEFVEKLAPWLGKLKTSAVVKHVAVVRHLPVSALDADVAVEPFCVCTGQSRAKGLVALGGKGVLNVGPGEGRAVAEVVGGDAVEQFVVQVWHVGSGLGTEMVRG